MNRLQRDFFEQGFLVVPQFLNTEEVESMLDRSAAMVESFDPEVSRSVFSTTEEGNQERDAYFLDSGDKIRFFWETEAVDKQGHICVDKSKGINKIGHALHDLDPTFSQISHSGKVRLLLRELGYDDPLFLQSMLIFKHPKIGGEVSWHQDQTFLFTEPEPVIGLWFALEDANKDNGCLWAAPGAHHSPLRSRLLRHGYSQEMQQLDSTPWPDAEKIPLEVPKGTLIVLHGMLPHMSFANRSDVPRKAYTLHVTQRSAHYAKENWLQRPNFIGIEA